MYAPCTVYVNLYLSLPHKHPYRVQYNTYKLIDKTVVSYCKRLYNPGDV